MNVLLVLKLLHALRQLRQHERWTHQQIEAFQAKALARVRTFAYASSPFYQKFHQGLMERPIHELPVLTKALMMENFDDLVTNRALRLEEIRAFAKQDKACKPYLGRYWITATSGSSGRPGFFVFDQSEWIWILASFARSQEWSGVKINLTHRQRMATVASISPWHMSSQVSATVKSWWRPSLRLPASQPLSETVMQLNHWQPEVLVSYASMAGILAEEQLAGRLHIQPEYVYTSSEVLTRQTRNRIWKAWGNEPFNQYAATETASIAVEHHRCRHMHFFEDLVYVEVVDDQYRPVPAGEFGSRLLITTLFSRTQPLIRYELKDSICVRSTHPGCLLPFTVMEDIQGREEDILHLPGVSGGKVDVQPLVFNRIMDILPLGEWQVVQQADNGLEVLVTGTREQFESERLHDQLVRSLAEEGIWVPYVHVKQVTTIPKNASGKTPLIRAYHHDSSAEKLATSG